MVTELYTAVVEEQIEVVSELIRKGEDVNANGLRTDTLLHVAVELCNEELVKLLLKSGACVDRQNGDENTPLHLAVLSRSLNIIKLLLEANADILILNLDNLSPLITAIWTKNLNIVQIFLDNMADINMKDDSGDTPLHYAAEVGNSNVVKLLLAAGADVSVRNKSKRTSLHKAIYFSENINILKLLIDAGSDVNAMDEIENTPLMLALACKNEKITKFLLESGANVNAKNFLGEISLHVAINAQCDVNILKILIKAGADVNCLDDYEDSPCTILINCENLQGYDEEWIKKCLKLLIEYTDVNITNKYEENILSYTLGKPDFLTHVNFHDEILIKHVAKLKVLGLKINSELLDRITASKIYNDYFIACVEELEIAKSTRLHKCWVTFFKLLVDDKSKLIKYAGNQNLIEDFKNGVKKFPIYEEMLQSNVNKGIYGRKLYDTATCSLSNRWPIFDITHLIIKDTLEILEETDWKKLFE